MSHGVEHVLPDRSCGLYFGSEKNGTADLIFASIFTFGMKKHQELFAVDDFDLIVVDEFHHAAAKSYKAVLDYFQPKFLLGITATPDRMDGKDVYALCDGNVAFQLHYIEAIVQGWLTPFHYYGVYDDTDYTQIRWLGSRYDDEQLLTIQLKEDMAEKIYNAWMKYKQTRTLVFCSSSIQADFLSVYFNKKGINTVSLHSKTIGMSREEAIRQLTDGKDMCTIIDLIGNYRNADTKLKLFDAGFGIESKNGNRRETAIAEASSGRLHH